MIEFVVESKCEPAAREAQVTLMLIDKGIFKPAV